MEHPFWNRESLVPHASQTDERQSNSHQNDALQDNREPTPFVAETRRQDLIPSGPIQEWSAAPAARLLLTPALRTGGLWHALPGEEIKTLILVLTFLAPDGTCRPALAELAPAMHLPEGKARIRLERLAAARWQGMPVLRELPRDSGLHAFVPAPSVLAVAEAAQEAPQEAAEASLMRGAGKEAVVAHSRALYARPRAEVEREMALRMGWEDPEALRQAREREEAALTDEGRDLLARLLGLGVERAQALELLVAYGSDSIRRQVEWLPLRGAKNAARFLVAAIQGDYAPPVRLRVPGARQETQAPEAETGESGESGLTASAKGEASAEVSALDSQELYRSERPE